jgi:hypothetical protein
MRDGLLTVSRRVNMAPGRRPSRAMSTLSGEVVRRCAVELCCLAIKKSYGALRAFPPHIEPYYAAGA